MPPDSHPEGREAAVCAYCRFPKDHPWHVEGATASSHAFVQPAPTAPPPAAPPELCANCSHSREDHDDGRKHCCWYDDVSGDGSDVHWCACTKYVERTMWNCMKCYPRLCHCADRRHPAPSTGTTPPEGA